MAILSRPALGLVFIYALAAAPHSLCQPHTKTRRGPAEGTKVFLRQPASLMSDLCLRDFFCSSPIPSAWVKMTSVGAVNRAFGVGRGEGLVPDWGIGRFLAMPSHSHHGTFTGSERILGESVGSGTFRRKIARVHLG